MERSCLAECDEFGVAQKTVCGAFDFLGVERKGVQSNAQFSTLDRRVKVRRNLPTKMKFKLFALVLLSSLCAATSLWSGEIIQPQANGSLNIFDLNPLGQTFTAEDSRISSIGFEVWATTQYSSAQLTYELREGAVPYSGLLLASASFTLPTTFRGYADADFSSVTLTVGQVYTVLLFASNPSFLVDWNQWADDNGPIPGRIDYTGGEAMVRGLLTPRNDLTFRIEPLQPTIACPPNTTVECGSSTTVTVLVGGPTVGNSIVVWTLNGAAVQTNLLAASTAGTNVAFSAVLPLGTNLLAVTVSDTASNSASCSTMITVVDTTPPVIQSLTASPDMLWPPNHKFVPVRLQVVSTDECGPATWRIISVSSNEAEEARGSGHTSPDWQIISNDTVLLRAERSGKGNGRLYTITVQATDLSGNTSQATVTVSVPQDRGKKLRP